jgi:hypothetical protein
MNVRLTIVAAVILGYSAFPALAAEPQATFEELQKCSGLQDATQRLRCYDALMPRVRAALAKGPEELSRDDQATLFGFNFSDIFGSSGGAASTPQTFGSNDLPQPEPAVGSARAIESITAIVKEHAMTPTGKFIVFLDNGQVWRQQQGDTGTARFRSSRENKVVISHGMLGSYTLQLNGSNQVFKVNRVK